MYQKQSQGLETLRYYSLTYQGEPKTTRETLCINGNRVVFNFRQSYKSFRVEGHPEISIMLNAKKNVPYLPSFCNSFPKN